MPESHSDSVKLACDRNCETVSEAVAPRLSVSDRAAPASPLVSPQARLQELPSVTLGREHRTQLHA